MKTCHIFCAGGFEKLACPIEEGDYILAADGGLKHLQALGLQPHGILGDFDSLGFVPEGAQVFPVEKDDTDSMLAVRKGLALGYVSAFGLSEGGTDRFATVTAGADFSSLEQVFLILDYTAY